MSGSQPPNGTQGPRSVPPGAGLQWTDYPRDVFTAPYFATSALGEIFAPAIKDGAIQVIPQIIQPIVNQAADQAVRRLAVMKTGDTMVGRLFSSHQMPAADTEYVTKYYVDTMVSSSAAAVPEVPFFPQNALWVRQYGQWVQYTSPDPNNFLLLAGGTMQGIINMGANSIDNLAPYPVMPNGAAPASWVLSQLASVSLYQGLYDANNNNPDLSSPSLQQNGWTWIAVTDPDDVPVTVTAGIPGLVNQTLNNGDTVVYSSRVGQFQIIRGGGLTIAEAQALFLPLGGGTMVGPLMLARDPQSTMEAVTMGWVTNQIGQGFPEVPDDGLAYARSYGAWVSIDDLPIWNAYLPLTGGTLTGPLYLSQDASDPREPVTLSQMQENAASVTIASAPPATPLPGALWWDDTIAQMFIWYDDGSSEQWVQANSMSGGVFLPLTGGTVSGPLTVLGALTLNAGATQPLQAVPLQQLQAAVQTQSAPTISQPRIMGVTDGSNAGPGEVGEYVENSNVQVGSTTAGVTVTLALSAGDWQVSGWWYSQTAGGNVSSMGATLYLNGSPIMLIGAPTNLQARMSLNGGGGQVFFAQLNIGTPSVRINMAAAFAVALTVDPGIITNGAWIAARRMR